MAPRAIEDAADTVTGLLAKSAEKPEFSGIVRELTPEIAAAQDNKIAAIQEASKATLAQASRGIDNAAYDDVAQLLQASNGVGTGFSDVASETVKPDPFLLVPKPTMSGATTIGEFAEGGWKDLQAAMSSNGELREYPAATKVAEQRAAEKRGWGSEIKVRASALNDSFLQWQKANPGATPDDYSKFIDNVNAYFDGDIDGVVFPEQVRTAVRECRDSLDALKMKALQGATGPLQGKLSVTVANNKFYLHRAYSLFDDPEYLKKVLRGDDPATQQKFSAAYQTLVEQNIPAAAKQAVAANLSEDEAIKVAQRRAADTLGQYISDAEMVQSKRFQNLPVSTQGLVKYSMLQERNDIPEPVRQFMGEVKDPRARYMTTAAGLADMVTSFDFANRMKTIGKGSFLFDLPTGRATVQLFPDVRPQAVRLNEKGEAIKPVKTVADAEDEETRKWNLSNPLSGMYCTPEFKNALDQYFNQMRFHSPTLAAVNSMASKFYTTYIPNSHGRNWFSMLPVLQNSGCGVIPLAEKEFKGIPNLADYTYKTFRGDIGGLAAEMYGKKDLKASQQFFMNHLEELGIVNQQATTKFLASEAGKFGDNSVMDIIHNQILEARKQESMALQAGAGVKKGLTKAGETLGNMDTGITRFYQLPDDLTRLTSFLHELRIKSTALGVPMTNLALQQSVANYVKNIIPTYERSAQFVKYFRQLPVLGQFVSYPSEYIRCSANVIRQAAMEMRDTNPLIRAIGINRMLNSGLMQAGLYGSVWGINRAVAGITDPEERAIRQVGPSYNRNALMAFWRNKDGTYGYHNLSYLFPQTYLLDPLTAMSNKTKDGDILGGMYSALQQLVSPFVNTKIGAQYMGAALANRDVDTGDPISDPNLDDEFTGIAKRAFYPFAKMGSDMYRSSLQKPIMAATGERGAYGRVISPMDVALSTFGSNVTMDPASQVKRFAFQYKTYRDDIRNKYYQTVTKGGNLPWGKNDGDVYKGAMTQLAVHQHNLYAQLQALRALDVSPGKMTALLKEAGLSNSEITTILNGTLAPMSISKDKQKLAIQQGRPIKMNQVYEAIKEMRNTSLNSLGKKAP